MTNGDQDALGGIIFITHDDRVFKIPKEILEQHEIKIDDKPLRDTHFFAKLTADLDGYFFSHRNNLKPSAADPTQHYVLYLAEEDTIDPDVYVPTIDSASGEEP